MTKPYNKPKINKNHVTALIIFLLFTLTFLIYLPALFHGFVYDDTEQVLANPWITNFSHLSDIFFTPSWSFMKEGTGSNYYRPMMHIVFLLERSLFGLSPLAFHLVNVSLHAINTVLVFMVVRTLLLSLPAVSSIPLSVKKSASSLTNFVHGISFVPLITALIFALHPINTEVVNWVSAVPELTYTFFLLLSLYLFITGVTADANLSSTRRALPTAFGCFLFFLALLSKETAMSFLLLIITYEYLRLGRTFIRRYLHYLPYIITAILYMALRTYALGALAQKQMTNLNAYESIINIFPTAVRYSAKLLWPSNLSIIYAFKPYYSLKEPFVILSIFLTLLFLALVIYLRRSKRVLFALLWILFPILPVLYLPFVSTGGFADRYLYLPSAGFGLLVASALLYLAKVRGDRSRIVLLLSISLMVIYTTYSVKRSFVWKDHMSLWSDTVKKTPDNALVNMGLGEAYLGASNPTKAAWYYNKVLRQEPFNYKAHYNLAIIYQDMGQSAKAAEHYKKTIKLNPLLDTAYFNLASLYAREGKKEKAIYYYKESLRVNPANKNARASLASLYNASGDSQMALSALKEAVRRAPEDNTAHYNLAWGYQEAGQNTSAINEFKEALRLAPADAKTLYALGWLYHFTGDISNAKHYYKESIKADPSKADAYFNLSLIYADSGQWEKSAQNLKKVLEIDPSYREAKERLKESRSKSSERTR